MKLYHNTYWQPVLKAQVMITLFGLELKMTNAAVSLVSYSRIIIIIFEKQQLIQQHPLDLHTLEAGNKLKRSYSNSLQAAFHYSLVGSWS